MKLRYKPNILASHASLPTPLQLDQDRVRLFFAARDVQNRSHVCYLDLDKGEVASEPQIVFEPGEKGMFDQHGVSPACVIQKGSHLWLYYMGWNLGADVPFRNAIGVAAWNTQQDKFVRISKGPILDRSHTDPITLSYPFVMKMQTEYLMWYGSHLSWETDLFPMQHVIKTARSEDLFAWRSLGGICLGVEHQDYAFSRPWVLRTDQGYEMYYCFRGESYQIGYATSPDGFTWQRQDDRIQFPELPDWASEMQCYPTIAEWGGQKHLLFNGNGYGKTGIGYITL